MLYTLKTSAWKGPFSAEEQKSAITALEAGEIIYFPHLSFVFNPAQSVLLSPEILDKGSKNISFHPPTGKLKGIRTAVDLPDLRSEATALMAQFFQQSQDLLNILIPQYQNACVVGRTSYRPVEVAGRKTSLLQDDTRLHVDAFPATPNQGQRILRIFANVNPMGQPRLWHLGEPFEKVVAQFLPKLRKPIWGSRKILECLKITKSYRSLYDHYMLMLHNAMKKSDAYQQQLQKFEMPFPAGSTWIVMTDCVSHAALSGQFLLEQTFYLPVSAMADPEKSPLRVLARAGIL